MSPAAEESWKNVNEEDRFARWLSARTTNVLPIEEFYDVLCEYRSGKLIILRTGGEVRIRSVDL